MSHSRTSALVDKLGVGFDDRVLEWKADVEQNMDSIVSVFSMVTVVQSIGCTCTSLCSSYFYLHGIGVGEQKHFTTHW